MPQDIHEESKEEPDEIIILSHKLKQAINARNELFKTKIQELLAY